jgi:cytidine deaminase
MSDFASREPELIAAALRARESAYAPYSRYAVGAALLTSEGAIHVGVNVENASLGLTQCAERNAVARAVAEGSRRFLGIVVATGDATPAAPCGACRQVLAEFADDLPVVLVNAEGVRRALRLDPLLPERFDGFRRGDER